MSRYIKATRIGWADGFSGQLLQVRDFNFYHILFDADIFLTFSVNCHPLLHIDATHFSTLYSIFSNSCTVLHFSAFFTLFCIVLYHPALSFIVLTVLHCRCTDLQCTGLSFIVLYFPASSCIILLWPSLSCYFLHCPVLSCILLHFPAFSCTVLHGPALSWITLHCPALTCTFLHCPAQSCALSCIVLHYPALSCAVLRCPALSCSALHCSAFPCTVLHCHELPCTVLHCPVMFCIISYIVLHSPTFPCPLPCMVIVPLVSLCSTCQREKV